MADRYARAVLDRRYPSAPQAARALLRERDRLRRRLPGAGWLRPDRSYMSAKLKVARRLRMLGRPLGWAPNSAAEKRLFDRYARAAVSGQYPSVLAAARACHRELGQQRQEHPGGDWPKLRRTVGGVLAQLHLRARKLGDWWGRYPGFRLQRARQDRPRKG